MGLKWWADGECKRALHVRTQRWRNTYWTAACYMHSKYSKQYVCWSMEFKYILPILMWGNLVVLTIFVNRMWQHFTKKQQIKREKTAVYYVRMFKTLTLSHSLYRPYLPRSFFLIVRTLSLCLCLRLFFWTECGVCVFFFYFKVLLLSWWWLLLLLFFVRHRLLFGVSIANSFTSFPFIKINLECIIVFWIIFFPLVSYMFCLFFISFVLIGVLIVDAVLFCFVQEGDIRNKKAAAAASSLVVSSSVIISLLSIHCVQIFFFSILFLFLFLRLVL